MNLVVMFLLFFFTYIYNLHILKPNVYSPNNKRKLVPASFSYFLEFLERIINFSLKSGVVIIDIISLY